MTAAADPSPRWQDALLAAQLFAIDPAGLGGVSLAGGDGPPRDLWLDHLRRLLPFGAPWRRLPAGIADDRLIGAVDLTATLARGRPVMQKGVLAEADGGVVIVPMAERLSAGLAARIAGVLDRGALAVEREGIAGLLPARIGVVAFDDGIGDDEAVPAALLDRFAFLLDFTGLPGRGLEQDCADADGVAVAVARRRLPSVPAAADSIVEALVATAAAFGIDGVMAPLLALRASRAAAAWAGHGEIDADDAALAARLVLGPRARLLPADENEVESEGDDEGDSEQAADTAPPPEQPDRESSEPEQQDRAAPRLEDILLAAVRSALPDDLLGALKSGVPGQRRPASTRQGSAASQASLARGRPAGVRIAPLRPGARLALVETLRAAAPWQALRRGEAPANERLIQVRREDLRLKKFVQRREATIIFCVDASGSAAFQRLAETKGAVELTLAGAYAARTHAALVTFRGNGADLLLPPTRSLSRAKALLATLPGGGGTPLASGLDLALMTALSERAKGREPLIILLTDGRANIGRDGKPARPGAIDQAFDAARQLALTRIATVLVDTSARPRPEAAELAAAMAARYVALPYVEAHAVRDLALGS